MAMEMRPATRYDVPALARGNRELILDEWNVGETPSLERLEARMERWLEEGDYRAVIFEEEGTAVGYALFSTDEESAYIRQFFVFQERRRGGVGRRAMELLLSEAIPPTARVTLDVLASNQAGHGFWRSAGFADYSVRMERLPREPA